jgi:hypothetical protein
VFGFVCWWTWVDDEGLEWVGFVVTMGVVFVYTGAKFVWVKGADFGGNIG